MDNNTLGIIFLVGGLITFIFASKPAKNILAYRNYFWISANILFITGVILRAQVENHKWFLAGMLIFANVQLWRRIKKEKEAKDS